MSSEQHKGTSQLHIIRDSQDLKKILDRFSSKNRVASDIGNTGNTGILLELSCHWKNTGKHTLFHPN